MAEPTIHWPEPPGQRSIRSGEIHVWAANLEAKPEQIALYAKFLSFDEHARSERFRFEEHRSRFIVGRGVLRSLLGQYLGHDPACLKFDYAVKGKPALADSRQKPGLYFNLAHSDALMLLALTQVCELGIDVERVRPLADADGIVTRFFSPREVERFQRLPEDLKAAAFFNLWTRKESWLKATGEGINEALNQVEVSFAPGEPAQLISVFGAVEAAHGWTLLNLQPAAGFVGALAVQSKDFQLHQWKWRD